MFNHLDLFSGIAGFAYGLQLCGGYQTVGFCEIDSFCQKVIRKNFPGVVIFDDIRTLTGDLVRERCGRIDIITAGVPCQPASCAGKRRGSSDDRWLWPEFLRVVREVRPRCVLAENVTGFVTLEPDGLDWLQDNLEAEGYETFAFVCGAEAVGAPHRRERVWIVGMDKGRLDDSESRRESGRIQPTDNGTSDREINASINTGGIESLDNALRSRRRESADEICARRDAALSSGELGDTGSGERDGLSEPTGREQDSAIRGSGEAMADSECINAEPRQGFTRIFREATSEGLQGLAAGSSERREMADTECSRRGTRGGEQPNEESKRFGRGEFKRSLQHWPSRPGEPQHEWEEPRLLKFGVDSSASRVSERLVRSHNRSALKAIGNSVAPQLVAVIGEALKGII